MDWSVLIAVVLVCMFTLGYMLYSGSLMAQNQNSHKSVRSANEYDAAVSKLSARQVDKTREEIRNFNEHLRSGGSLDPFSPDSSKVQDASAKTDDYAALLKKVSPEMAGYLTVPKADFSGPIYYGDINESLVKGVGYLPGTALPSDVKGTRSVLFGHTGLDNLHVFDDVDRLKKGDTFSVRMLNTTYHYKVSDITIVRPDQVDALRPEQDKTIVTLLTCTPKGINDHRLLVSGELTSVSKDKPELKQVRSPTMLIVTIIPLAACAIGAVYVWLRRQQVHNNPKPPRRRRSQGRRAA
ncbi:class C sortase [Bombiscardovia nodaiensis]|uniref:Class C sortase n=1 Tax=Bombiscardovia nodaiensis TaxID=2932181 RepID=A0ABM8B5Q6_9BIFI|nr:class C sortase [Bombiscardovia nodaiensis]